MIDAALGAVPHTPDAYAEFLNAVVGRPLALANIGYSLELAAPPVRSQATTASDRPQPAAEADAVLLNDYPFRVKLGDKDRVFDGLVGYFEASSGTPTGGADLDLSTIHTYFPAPSPPAPSGTTPVIPPTTGIASNYPPDQAVPPAYRGARRLQPGGHGAPVGQGPLGAAAHGRRADGSVREGALVHGDPAGRRARASAWSLQSAMRSMRAFFHCGPLIVTNGNALQYSAAANVSDTSAALVATTGAPVGVALPALRSADWEWLAPFVGPSDAGSGGASGTGASGTGQPTKATKWNAFPLTSLDNKPKYEKGPYVAIEGFLQLNHPITAPDTI